MRHFLIDDTIAAISTPVGESGIGIIRMSGKAALAIADSIFLSGDSARPSKFKSHAVHYGWIARSLSPTGGNTRMPADAIDEVLLTVMRAPRTYTREDIVEINCHGGVAALSAVLELVLARGARLAEPGEFTRRAFLNGRIDLAQAEAVLDIIRAKTDSALKISTEQLRGTLSKKINRIRETALAALAILETGIDFPEEDSGVADQSSIVGHLENAKRELSLLLEASRYGRILREGLRSVICGRPNVGKSSLLNAILRQERSIVAAVPGTTRDTIEEIINIKGIPLKIVDTAGMAEPKDLVERKAVARSKKYMEGADLVLLVFDGSKKLTREDRMLIKKLLRRTTVAVINKSDLRQIIQEREIREKFAFSVSVSAKKGTNMSALEDAILEIIGKGKVIHPESALVSNLRHIEKLKEAQKFIVQARDSLDNRVSGEFVAQDIKDAVRVFDEMLGRESSEDLLDKIFSEFCIGK